METALSRAEIHLSNEEAEILREALTAYLSELRIETSRTDDKTLRDHLLKREEVIESVLGQLNG